MNRKHKWVAQHIRFFRQSHMLRQMLDARTTQRRDRHLRKEYGSIAKGIAEQMRQDETELQKMKPY